MGDLGSATMSPSFDWAMSSLLCAEDNNELLENDDFGENDHEQVEETSSSSAASSLDHMNLESTQSQKQRFQNRYSFTDVLCVQSDDYCLDSMMEKECQHLPEDDYLARLRSGDVNLCGRMNAVDWIIKVHAYYGFGPLSLYLSVNYLDRFLSAYELPDGQVWMMQLLAVACLSIAAKMEETEIPLTLDFQVAESEFIFEARTIQKMELLVLTTLGWRMQAVTPFSFVDSFLCKLNGGDQRLPVNWLERSVQLILSTVKDIEYLEFRPCEIAAAVAIGVTGMNQTPVGFQTAITLLGLLASKERVVKVSEVLHDLVLMVNRVGTVQYRGSDSSVDSPNNGVLDGASVISYKSETSTTDFESCASSSTNTTPDNKRRKKEGGWGWSKEEDRIDDSGWN